MAYGPPSWSSKAPITAVKLQNITDSIDWQHDRIPYSFAIADGTLISDANGIGECVGKIDVDPATYPDYSGHPGPCGYFTLRLPAGLFASLLTVEVQAASGGNGAMTAVVNNETVDSISVFVNDSGGTTITPFAIWVYVKGVLKAGKIP